MFLTGFPSFSRKHGCISRGALERLIGTVHLSKPWHVKIRHVILTLDPKKFAEKKQKRLQIDDILGFRPHIWLLKQSSLVVGPRLDYDKTNERLSRLPFPPDTKAFLYYSIPPGKPRIAGELRLRVASSDDYASFESGSDLLRSNGRPWSRTLYALSNYSVYNRLYEKMREEGLVSDDLDEVLSNLPLRTYRYRRNHHLYTLNDPFIVDFSSTLLFSVITEHGVGSLPLYRTFFDMRLSKLYAPYTGSALIRFERSTLPEHEGTRTIVIRFLKIITPVKCVIPNYDGHICCPKEGELYWKYFINRKVKHKVWSDNIDISAKSPTSTLMRQSFKLLWDT